MSEVRSVDGAIIAKLKTGPQPFGVIYMDWRDDVALWVTSYGAAPRPPELGWRATSSHGTGRT